MNSKITNGQVKESLFNLSENGLQELSSEQLIHISGGGVEDTIIDPISDYKRKLV